METINRQFDNNLSDNIQKEQRYEMAYKRVKRIKGFYVHAAVYVFVNILIVAGNYAGNSNRNLDFLSWQTFSTAFFWGIGLAAHGLSVFGSNLFFGQNWQERKIQELMDKDKGEKWE